MFGWFRKMIGRKSPALSGKNKPNMNGTRTGQFDADRYIQEKAAKLGENSLSTAQKKRLAQILKEKSAGQS